MEFETAAGEIAERWESQWHTRDDLRGNTRGAKKNLEVTTPSAALVPNEETSQPSTLEVMP
jgi:hypothetical protein